ncbi:MAG: HAMP domain-containing histidine kinase [Spirochaetaceae bacterium]|nr:HAMP domain-containing histidine kinase [Spirochaetaceae bacterium]
MKKRLLLVFLILIFMPVTVITVMGIYTYRNSLNKERESLKEAAEEILIVNDRLLQNRIRLIEDELEGLSLDPQLTTDEIRPAMNRERLVKQAFIIDGEDQFIYPPIKGDTSSKEKEFLAEAESIELVSNLRARISPVEKQLNQSQWYTWFMGDGLNFINFSEKDNMIYGYLVERYSLVSQLINVLPQDRDDSFRIQLTDARGGILYQWGNYSHGETEKALLEHSLGEPLGSWRLFYFHNEKTGTPIKTTLGNIYIIPVIVLLSLIIFFLAYYFYRENTREMETARKQVTFVNQVSHELKTPLTNIRLYSELLQNKLVDPKERNFLDIIVRESNRLGRMINNVLTFSRGERGELKSQNKKTDINLLISEILEKFGPLLKENSMKIIYRENPLPAVVTDKDMIEQILNNIIGNAVKYGSAGKYLGIETEVKKDVLIIYIDDRGPGIPEPERELIFKPFYRIDNSLTQNNSGTGIGLSLAKTLAEETGSLLKIEKSPVGACFSLAIPLEGEKK